MKTASTLLQLIALMACFAAHQAFSDEMTGVRRAVEMTAGICKPQGVSAPAIYSAWRVPALDIRRLFPTRRYAAAFPMEGEEGVAPPASVCRKASPQAFARSRTRRI